MQHARLLSASVLLITACGGVAAESARPDASAADAPARSSEGDAAPAADASSGSNDAGLIGPIDAGVADAGCTPIAITFDASAYPPFGQCCTSASDCEVDAGFYAGVQCGDTTATLQPCCRMSHCTIVPNHTQ